MILRLEEAVSPFSDFRSAGIATADASLTLNVLRPELTGREAKEGSAAFPVAGEAMLPNPFSALEMLEGNSWIDLRTLS